MQQTLVDSHCHLDMLDVSKLALDDIEHVIKTAADNGVSHMLCVSVNLEDWPGMMSIVDQFPNVYASVGVHPNEREGKDPSVEELVELARHPKVVAIGETGLDYYYHKDDTEWQRERFRRHIAAAKQCKKPIIVHCRDAKDDVLRILKEENAAEVGGVMHCFVDDWATAEQAINMNFYISFSGIVTFRTALTLKEVAKQTPLEWMLVETDSPYLAPMPHRGKTNQPAYTRNVAEHIAELRSLSLEDIATATTANFFKLFKAKA
jgi:TatD DNase family protein